MKTNPALRVIAFVLCVLSASAAFWSMVISFRYWDEMWTDADYYSSSNFRNEIEGMSWYVHHLAELRGRGDLTYTQRNSLSSARMSLDPSATNFRYELRRDDTGELVESNLDGERLEDVATGIQMEAFTVMDHEALHSEDVVEDRLVGVTGSETAPDVDYVTGDGVEEPAVYEYQEVLLVWTGEKYLEFPGNESPEGYNVYGWYNNGDGSWLDYDVDRDSRIAYTSYALRCGVAADLPVDDSFRAGYAAYNQWHSQLPTIGVLFLAGAAVFVLTLVFLCFAAGRREGSEEIALTWIDRVPLEVLGAVAFGMVMLGMALCADIYHGLIGGIRRYLMVALMVISSVAASGAVGFVLTTAVRVKAHKLPESLLTWQLCRWGWRLVRRVGRAAANAVKSMVRSVSMNVRLGVAFAVYLIINAALAWGLFRTYEEGFFLIGLVLFNGGVFWLGCRWIDQWRCIRTNTQRILGGETNVQINTSKMYSDLKNHAEQLNDLGSAIDHAVDERLKSEHFKAELITNVSHDLKTPLTSIINYVDLLKKTNITDPRALEYLEVLDRKSQRLKKLTEDLVEASKASTGNVTVNAARLDLVEFTQQATAEYADRLCQQRLTLVTKMADRPVYISADGRHMWRILDNLLANCVKYALEGTRVYLDVVEWDGKASISVKNISRDQLNVDPSELTERFVRGDESRTTEGSGLGLSIARSLTEVQGGTFRVSTDGDLFKVSMYFPVMLALEDNNLGERKV